MWNVVVSKWNIIVSFESIKVIKTDIKKTNFSSNEIINPRKTFHSSNIPAKLIQEFSDMFQQPLLKTLRNTLMMLPFPKVSN